MFFRHKRSFLSKVKMAGTATARMGENGSGTRQPGMLPLKTVATASTLRRPFCLPVDAVEFAADVSLCSGFAYGLLRQLIRQRLCFQVLLLQFF
jgi:hypothetical protein